MDALARYEHHLDELRDVLGTALARAVAEYPEHGNDLYVVGLDVDGQYHRVTVGVGNVRDFKTTVVDTTRLGDPASQAEASLTEDEFWEVMRTAADEVEAVSMLRERFEADDDPPARPRRRELVVRYDVTGLPDHEVDALAAEASVQAERSDGYAQRDDPPRPDEYTGHRDVPFVGSIVVVVEETVTGGPGPPLAKREN